MSFDNRIFNVNGFSPEMLLSTLDLVFYQHDGLCEAWSFSVEYGLILHSAATTDTNRFPCKMTASNCFAFVRAWLASQESKSVLLKGWDSNYEHDGSNRQGWRVYCGDWGHIGEHHSAICAITPAFIWYGK